MSRRAAPKASATEAHGAEVFVMSRRAAPKAHRTAAGQAEVFP